MMVKTMAKKRTKKEAKARIDSINVFDTDSDFVDIFPRTERAIAVLNIIEEAAKSGGKILVELDPLDRLQDAGTTRTQQLKNIVTDEGSTIPIAQLADLINDPETAMDGNGNITRTVRRARQTGRDVIRGSNQFRRDLILPSLPKKRKRKKTSSDRKLSKAFKEANAKLRLKNGRLKKGKTQSDVAKLAHRLKKKMK